MTNRTESQKLKVADRLARIQADHAELARAIIRDDEDAIQRNLKQIEKGYSKLKADLI